MIKIYKCAAMVELADTQDSKSCDRKVMRVRPPLAAPKRRVIKRVFFISSDV